MEEVFNWACKLTWKSFYEKVEFIIPENMISSLNFEKNVLFFKF